MLVIADFIFIVVLPHNAIHQDHLCADYTFWKVAGITVCVRSRQYLPNRCSRQGSQLYNNFLLQLVQFYLSTLVIWRAAHGVRKY
jgi:hypothetical protein